MLIPSNPLTNQAFTLAGSAALSQILYAFLVALAATRSGPAGFGLAAGAIGLGGFLAGLLDFGTTAYSIRELSADRMTQGEYWDRLQTKLVVGAVGGCAIMVIALIASHPQLGGFVALVMVGRTVVTGVSVPPRAAHQVVRVAIVTVVDRASSLIAFAVASMGLSLSALTALWWSLGIGAGIAGAVGLALANGGAELLRRTTLRNPWADVAGYGKFSLAVSATTLDVVVLGLAGGSVQAGLYGAVGRWTQPVQLLSQAFSSAATPFIARARSARAAFEVVGKSIWILGLGVASCLLIIITAPTVIPALLGPSYRTSAPALAVLAAGAAVVVVNQPLATFLQSRGYDQFVGRWTTVTVLLQLVGVWLAAHSLGALGAAVSYALSQVALTLVLVLGAGALMRGHGMAAPRKATGPAGPRYPQRVPGPGAHRAEVE